MSQIKQMLRLHQQWGGKKDIGISRNTVKTYLDKIAAGWEIDDLLALDDNIELILIYALFLAQCHYTTSIYVKQYSNLHK